MARTVKPGEVKEIKAPQYKVTQPDFSAFEDAGDAQIKAANENFKLYADSIINNESLKQYEQFKNDPINLANALSKLPDVFNDLPDEIQGEAKRKLYLKSVALIQKAQDNFQREQDKQNKRMADENIALNKSDIAKAYANVLQNQAAKAEDKRPIVNNIFIQQASELKDLADLKNDKGNDAYTAQEKDNIANIAAVQLDSSKQFFEDMLANDNDDLENSREYLKDITENPVSFKNQTLMPDNVYDAYKSYAEQRIDQQQNLINNRRKIDNHLAFLDNPIVNKAKIDKAIYSVDPSGMDLGKFGERAFEARSMLNEVAEKDMPEDETDKKLEEVANEIYSIADKVNDGDVPLDVLKLGIMKIASVTVDDKDPSIVDNNLLKAFEGYLAWKKAGANQKSLDEYNKAARLAITDNTFKQAVAALAAKPDFDTMFLHKGGHHSLFLEHPFRSIRDEDTAVVEKIGRDAYLDTMDMLSYAAQAETEQQKAQIVSNALSYYDSQVQKAYDYIKRDIIDVDYVKNSLAKMGYAMVDLNGHMSKIVGRLPNGEYIIEETGDTVNETF